MLGLSNRAIMIVEDEYFVANELAQSFQAAQARVIGPFPTVSAALKNFRQADMAVLDLNLRGSHVYPLADKLMEAATPFVFYTAQDMTTIPTRFSHIGCLPKPYAAHNAVALFENRMSEISISALVPQLRLAARLIFNDQLAADRLVEATLHLALQHHQELEANPPLADWLYNLLHIAVSRRGFDLMN
jgi:DNA-binding LytR/AlgR family response regulator